MDRRKFLKYGVLAGLAAPFGAGILKAMAETKPAAGGALPAAGPLEEQPVYLFSKPIEDYSCQEQVEIAKGSGYQGLEITFRSGGGIKPEDGAREIPKFVRVAEAAGLKIPMAVTDIWNADRRAEEMIRVMADNGITHYRLVSKKYDLKIPIERNLEIFRAELTELSELNARYGMTAGMQNHTGMVLNAAVWDGWTLYKDLDPNYIGAQYDIRHAMADNMASWELPLRAAAGHIGSLCIKDFVWNYTPERGYRPVTVPLGAGLVNFGKFFTLLREIGVSRPFSMHIEFPILTDEQKSLPAANRVDIITALVRNEKQTLDNFLKP